MYKSAVARFARNNILVAQYSILYDEVVAGRFIDSIHQMASTACSCTMFPSTGGIEEPGSKGTKGLPCDLTTQSCPQHHQIGRASCRERV